MLPRIVGKSIIAKSLRASDELVHQIGTTAHVTSDYGNQKSWKWKVTHARPEIDGSSTPKIIRLGFLDHSLMRSMEINMLIGARSHIRPAIIDIGCGDGHFSSLLFEGIFTGLDLEPDILKFTIAMHPNLYRSLIVADASQRIPLEGGIYCTAISNSVIEHIPNTKGVVKEVARVLKVGGNFIFTTYTPDFVGYLGTFFGEHEADHFNRELMHVSLLTLEDWHLLLAEYGMKIADIRYYLSPDTAVWFRLISSRLFQTVQLLNPRLVWYLLKPALRRLVARSINLQKGAGILVVAQKIW